MPYPATPVRTRFARKYIPEPNSGCWLWTDALDRDGYGRLQIDGKAVKAHRLAYELHCGPVPSGKMVCHKCDTPCCVNPDHLYAGDNQANMDDMVRRGRSVVMINPNPGSQNGRAVLNEAQIHQVFHLSRKMSIRAVARHFGVTPTTIKRILTKERWAHVRDTVFG